MGATGFTGQDQPGQTCIKSTVWQKINVDSANYKIQQQNSLVAGDRGMGGFSIDIHNLYRFILKIDYPNPN